ncbi:diguanylate cyclase [Massilia sp. W12]|uniref:diguanylate cyclase domain-containing protein n=1 Tax=Massilia sp. W12 TaxID=3126507 RepID=UPI0030CEF13F
MKQALILLVDDQPANLHSLAAVLKADYRLAFATSGAQALQLAQENPPQLILLDIVMPEMDGLEVLRRLRNDPQHADIPVILVSGDGRTETELSALDTGGDDYLSKPVIPAILLARVRNLLQKKQTEAQLQLGAHVFSHSGEALLITDAQFHILDANPAFARLTGYASQEVRGRDPLFLTLEGGQKNAFGPDWPGVLAHLKKHDEWRGEVWNRHADGSAYPVLLTISCVRQRNGHASFFIGSMVDISEQKAAQDHFQQMAHHDALTGLPNRLHLNIHLEQCLALARRKQEGAALMFIDLDRFKHINDTLGHDVGDALLVQVAQRLRQAVRESDLVARLGGDEFVIVLHEAGKREQALPVAHKILTRMDAPYEIEAHQVISSPSIGIALYPSDGNTPDELMKHADIAMYHAKALGRNNAQFFRDAQAAMEQMEHH